MAIEPGTTTKSLIITLTSSGGYDDATVFDLTSNYGSVIPPTATMAELLGGIEVTVDGVSYNITINSQDECTTELVLDVPDIEYYIVNNVYFAIDYETLCAGNGVLANNVYSTLEGDTLRPNGTYFFGGGNGAVGTSGRRETGINNDGELFSSSYYFANPHGAGQSYGTIINGVYNEYPSCLPATTLPPPPAQTDICDDACVVTYEHRYPDNLNLYNIEVSLPETPTTSGSVYVQFDATNYNTNTTFYGIQAEVDFTIYQQYPTAISIWGLRQDDTDDWAPYNFKITHIQSDINYNIIQC